MKTPFVSFIAFSFITYVAVIIVEARDKAAYDAQNAHRIMEIDR